MRLRIGFQVTRIWTNYTSMFIPGLRAACAAKGADLIVFAGGSLRGPFTYDYQLNSIYRFLNPANLDAAILITPSLRGFAGQDAYDTFIESIGGLPFVSVSMEEPGRPSILVDNAEGVKAMVRHLATVHGRRRIAFVCGPEDIPEATERLLAYRMALESCDFPFDPALVVPGDFTTSCGMAAVGELLSGSGADFDAVIAANDDTALGVLSELARRGRRVPEDVAVAGFDDIARAASAKPPLSTVRQPVDEIVGRAAEVAFRLAAGQEVEREHRFAARPVYRASCGCARAAAELFARTIAEARGRDGPPSASELVVSLSPDLEPGDAGRLRALRAGLDAALDGGDEAALFAAVESLRAACSAGPGGKCADFRDRSGFWSLALDKLFLPGSVAGDPLLARLHHQAKALLADISRQEVSGAYQALVAEAETLRELNEAIQHSASAEELASATRAALGPIGLADFLLVLEEPAGRRALLADREGRPLDAAALRFEAGELLPRGYLAAGGPAFLYATPLYYREERFGYVCLSEGRLSESFYDAFLGQIGSALKRCLMLEERAALEAKIRAANGELAGAIGQLEALSRTDELTGIENRRGFLEGAGRSLALARRIGRPSVLYYVDLDGLKAINDRHGHAEGDAAIKAAARAIRATFRETDHAGRLGGDEFVALALDNEEGHVGALLERLRANAEAEDRALARPWRLSLSAGTVVSAAGDERPLEALLAEADNALYEEKRRKKERRG